MSEQVEMLLPPLCLSGLSLVSPGVPVFVYLLSDGESQKQGGLRLCSDYYDQDGETRRVTDAWDAGLRKWRGRERHVLEDG
ncbi:hypothetical protein DY000_02009413 [Brassica cretica]|uniref:Uncharacterized protein n=1 Tax=Brassica cretica TaxID=69181 RepID=A0ABQ7BW23_BRACR|nr:hypothetical protein DY000_02009413 [Brassica cretica]